ncbi:ABC transporter substrate-binding protein [Oscillospiraceae bacterium LTW-04]|nr:ABC transporter substrate-binding protein [Oscillospiraceae bacterium MB24-C1]
MRRNRVLSCLIALAIILVAGCGGTDTEAFSVTLPQKSTGQPRDEIVIATNQDITSTDPQAADELAAARVFYLIYDRLFNIDPYTGEILPSLVKSYLKTTDTVWIFSLRDDVYFHDGSRLTAQDVKFSLDRAKNSERVKAQLSTMKEVQALDDFTVKVVLNEPYQPFLAKLCLTGCSIVSKAAVENNGGRFKPIGTGPYRLTEWRVGNRIVLDRFEHYFDGISPTSRLVMRAIPDNQARLRALEDGEIQVAEWLDSADFEKVIENPGLKLLQVPSVTVAHIALNVTKPPLNNVLVRRAIARAIDKERLVRETLLGNGQAATTVLGPGISGYYDKMEGFPYDPQEAKKLLAQVGYPNGFTLELLTVESVFDFCLPLLQQNLADVGITLKVVPRDSTTFFKKINAGEQMAHIGTWNNVILDPDRSVDPFYSPYFGAASNRMRYKNTRVDALIEQGRRSADAQARVEIYRELQEIIVSDSPWVPLYSTNTTVCVARGIGGFSPHPANQHNYTRIVMFD